MIKVIIVDDHKLIREVVSLLLNKQPGIVLVGEAKSGEDAIKLAKEKNPDVILMDVRMPGIGGIHATSKILVNSPDVKIIALTSCDNEPFPIAMLKAGAKGYLTKGATLEKMTQAINTVFSGKNYLDPEVAQALALKKMSRSPNPQFDSLSTRELTIMMMVVNGMKVEEISERLYLSSKTVHTYRHNIFKKLNLKNDVELAVFALKHGFLEEREIS